MASLYRPPGSTSEEFQLFREQLYYIRTHHKGKKLPSVHVLGDLNFKDIDWPDRLSKSGSTLSQAEGQILIDMNDHGLEQMVHFPTREKNTLDLILTTLPSQFQDVHSPDKLSDHDIVSGSLKFFIPPIKKPRRKVYLYQKDDYESMSKDTLSLQRKNTSKVREATYKGLVRPVLDYGSSVWDPPGVVLQEELESVQKRTARFVTGNYNYEIGSMTGILGQLK